MPSYHVTIIQERHYLQVVEANSSAEAEQALGDQVRAGTIEPNAVYISDVQALQMHPSPQDKP